MSIYDYNANIVGEQLTPPLLRQSKLLAWLYVILKPVQYIRDLVFNDYADGSSYALYSGAASYVATDRVIFTDNKVYQNILACSGINCLNTTYWVKVNDNFIGARERIKYNSQIIILEAHLNKWFQNVGAPNQIYIQTNTILSSAFVMGASGATSSKMARSGVFATTFMGLSPSFTTQYNLTIYVPIGLYTALDATPANREKIIRNYADKYILAGITYNITTF